MPRPKYLLVLAAAAAALLVFVPGALSSTGAISTTDDSPPFNACLNGTSNNCNLYADKTDAFLSGIQNLGAGTYFFAVTDPGFAGANDGDVHNLSDGANGDFTTREFSLDGSGTVLFLGSGHLVDGGKIQLAPFDTTDNNGGVYQLTVCPIVNDLPDTQNCKNDNFKIKNDATQAAGDLTVSKTAIPSFTRTFTWGITKSVDKTSITQTNGLPAATFNYTVNVTHDAGTDSSWEATGEITVSNPNLFDVSGVDVTDAVDNGGSCSVTDGTNLTVPGSGSVVLDYTCTYGSLPSAGTNTATATWPDIGSPDTSGDGTAPVDFTGVAPTTLVDDCVSVSDTIAGSLGTVCNTDPSPTSLIYSNTVTPPALGACVEVDNTATFTTDTTGTTASASRAVTVCNFNAALTIGYWANHLAPNGTSGCTHLPNGTGCSSNGPWTNHFLPQSLGAYYSVTTFQQAAGVFAVNNCSNAAKSAQNAVACLAAQLLAAELNVANIANPCINPVIVAANAFLSSPVHYLGPTGSYSLTTSQRTQALTLQSQLVNYNQTGSC